MKARAGEEIVLALCGDVMPGRGIDQVLPYPGDPTLYEDYVKDARSYVTLAERVNGAIRRPVGFAELWGDALVALDAAAPDVRIVNLETSITRRGDPWPKGINYRMTPENVACLSAARVDCCTLANNHVLDWGRTGLLDTLDALRRAGIAYAGAGHDASEAAAPALIDLGGRGRVAVFAFASETSGVPRAWAAGARRPGVNLLPDLAPATAAALAGQAAAERRPDDVLVASIHWGGNWGYAIDRERRAFAHALLEGGFSLVHGHSSHHPLGFEVRGGRLILYGCGDFLNDYEGIAGRAEYRPELVLLYLARLGRGSGVLLDLDLLPFRIRRFRLQAATAAEAAWLRARLTREGAPFGTAVTTSGETTLKAHWHAAPRAGLDGGQCAPGRGD
jgi:poly-gamma-glutamate capsule biosynthesis protein CapA/YwtB (metallophosphatase superfamily)